MSRRDRCPTSEMLSAFMDRETGYPWNKLIERHLEGCHQCRGTLIRLRKLRDLLAADPPPDVRGSFESLQERFPAAGHRRTPLWKQRVALPLPALAGAVLLIVVLGFMLALLTARIEWRKMSIRRGPAGTMQVEVAAPVRDLETLLRSLDQQSFSQEIIINLPSDSHLIMLGKPQLLREAEFSRVRQ